MGAASSVALGPRRARRELESGGAEDLNFSPYETNLHPDMESRRDWRITGHGVCHRYGDLHDLMLEYGEPPNIYDPDQINQSFESTESFQPPPPPKQLPVDNSSPPTFLKLPLEVRLMIYEYVVEPLLDNPPLIPNRCSRLPKRETRPAIPSTIRAQFFAILIPPNLRNRFTLDYNPYWHLYPRSPHPEATPNDFAVIIPPRKATDPNCCYHSCHCAATTNTNTTAPCPWRCICPQRTRSDYQTLTALSLVNRQTNAELHRLIWFNSAVTFDTPKSFNILAATRPSTIPLIRGITLVLNFTDEQLHPRCAAYNPHDNPLGKMLLFLIKHYSPSSSPASFASSTTDPDPDPTPESSPAPRRPLLFFNIEFLFWSYPFSASNTANLLDDLIQHWSPLFRLLPTESIAIHFSPAGDLTLPEKEMAAKLRQAWTPASTAPASTTTAAARTLSSSSSPSLSSREPDMKAYLNWREKLLTVDEEGKETNYETFALPARQTSIQVPPLSVNKNNAACRCGGQVGALQVRGSPSQQQSQIRRQMKKGSKKWEITSATDTGVMGRVCHLLWRAPVVCRCTPVQH